MNTRLVLCLALVAVACGAAHDDKSLSASLDLNLNKGAAPAAAAQATAAASAGVAVLSAPHVSVDLSIKKEQVPLVTMSEAPCKKICKPMCTITVEKQCLTVDVPKKNCNIEKKTITKQFCEKKCKPSLSLALPEFKLPTLPQADNANPSTPPAAVAKTETQASLLKFSKSAALSASAAGATAKVAGSVDVDASLTGAKASVDVDVSASKDDRRLQGLPKADLDLQCHDVCVDVPFVLPELKCTETTEKVEKCTMTPNKECKEECICLPQKSLSFNLPKKPTVNLSLNKAGGL